MSRIEGDNHLIMFGLQGFIKSYLMDGFNESFKGKITQPNLLETVFKDGLMIKEYTLQEIRDRLHRGNF